MGLELQHKRGGGYGFVARCSVFLDRAICLDFEAIFEVMAMLSALTCDWIMGTSQRVLNQKTASRG